MADLKKLTILHSNDLHGDFLDENVNGDLVGGLSLLSGYVNKVRSEEESAIYCIAGDMFRGSVIDSEYKGVSTIEIMNMLSPDVVTIGNHETDYGIAHLLFIEKCAKFPIINANLHIKTNGARLFKPYHIMEIDGLKILFIGIITEEVLSQTRMPNSFGSTFWTSPQSEWNWPPVPEYDSKPFDVQATDATLLLTGEKSKAGRHQGDIALQRLGV